MAFSSDDSLTGTTRLHGWVFELAESDCRPNISIPTNTHTGDIIEIRSTRSRWPRRRPLVQPPLVETKFSPSYLHDTTRYLRASTCEIPNPRRMFQKLAENKYRCGSPRAGKVPEISFDKFDITRAQPLMAMLTLTITNKQRTGRRSTTSYTYVISLDTLAQVKNEICQRMMQ